MSEESSAPDNSPDSPTSPSPPPGVKRAQKLAYMHRPPRIVPNYGKKQRHVGVLPKSSVSRVLLYDNVTQQQMLDVKMSHLMSEQLKTGRLMDMHRKSFIRRHKQRQKNLANKLLHVHHTPPQLSLTNDLTANGMYARMSRDDVEAFTSGEESFDHHALPKLTDRHAKKAGRAQQDVLLLPSLTQERYGASTSFGFALHPPTNTTQRASQTALLYRELVKPATLLPDIHGATSGGRARMGKVLFRVDGDRDGLTRILHTFQQPESQGGGRGGGRRKGKGRGKGGQRTTEDERYVKLEKLLVRIEPPNEGYTELSPSFHSPRQIMTFTRPSSLHSSIFRRRSTASSLAAASFVINSL